MGVKMVNVSELFKSCKNAAQIEYRSNERTIMNYIGNCLSIFEVELEEFKTIKRPTHYDVNEHLEKILKNKIENYFDFPNKSEFNKIAAAPVHHQELIYEIISLVKSFLHDNFTLDCYKDLVDKINKNVEEMIKKLDEYNKMNADYITRAKEVMQMFKFIICSDERNSYFAKVYRSFKRLPECNNDELITEDEYIVLEFIKLNTQLKRVLESLRKECIVAYCIK